MPQRGLKSQRVRADLALLDDRFLIGVDEFNRVFNR